MSLIYDYHEAGFRVFPLYGISPATGRCECDRSDCEVPGKHPYMSRWNQTPYWSDDQLEAMVEYSVSTGFGVCLDNHLVVDVDRRNNGYESLRRLEDDLGYSLEAVAGFTVDTGGGGKHYYFTVPGDSRLLNHHERYPGIDFKHGLTGGSFVVGAGSIHQYGGMYEIAEGSPEDVGEAPESLLSTLYRAERTNASYEGVEVDDNEIGDMLEYVSSDVEHDDWIKVGMAIHDATRGEGFQLWDEWSARGEKYPGAEELTYRWHSFGKAPDPVRIGTLMRMAHNAGYVRPVTFEGTQEVPDAEPDEETPQKPRHVRMLEALQANDDAEMARVAELTWLIDGLVPSDSLGVVYGEPGCGKSFSVVDMACAIASGTPWQGIDTGEEGVVIYISAEGGNGMRFRKRAWEQVNDARAPLMRILPMATIMDERKDVDVLTQVLREYRRQIKQPIKMVVIDTLNRCMSGEENSNTEMAEFIRGCERIQHDHDCGVMIVHHSGKDAERGARGATALKAATDYEIAIHKKESMITIENTRAKDVEPMKPVQCKLEPVTIERYTDYKGRPITSLVPHPAGVADQLEDARRITDKQRELMDIIQRNVDAIGADDQSCERAVVKEEFTQSRAMRDVKEGSISSVFGRVLSELRSHGWIEYDRNEVRTIF